ncbi:MAG: hypothetical protein M1818_007530 [Claussenomyces sp. TS43310]|nr:MAG: hypothetical protein M1818_007530 [Claussenomyces sp. TS43310]
MSTQVSPSADFQVRVYAGAFSFSQHSNFRGSRAMLPASHETLQLPGQEFHDRIVKIRQNHQIPQAFRLLHTSIDDFASSQTAIFSPPVIIRGQQMIVTRPENTGVFTPIQLRHRHEEQTDEVLQMKSINPNPLDSTREREELSYNRLESAVQIEQQTDRVLNTAHLLDEESIRRLERAEKLKQNSHLRLNAAHELEKMSRRRMLSAQQLAIKSKAHLMSANKFVDDIEKKASLGRTLQKSNERLLPAKTSQDVYENYPPIDINVPDAGDIILHYQTSNRKLGNVLASNLRPFLDKNGQVGSPQPPRSRTCLRLPDTADMQKSDGPGQSGSRHSHSDPGIPFQKVDMTAATAGHTSPLKLLTPPASSQDEVVAVYGMHDPPDFAPIQPSHTTDSADNLFVPATTHVDLMSRGNLDPSTNTDRKNLRRCNAINSSTFLATDTTVSTIAPRTPFTPSADWNTVGSKDAVLLTSVIVVDGSDQAEHTTLPVHPSGTIFQHLDPSQLIDLSGPSPQTPPTGSFRQNKWYNSLRRRGKRNGKAEDDAIDQHLYRFQKLRWYPGSLPDNAAKIYSDTHGLDLPRVLPEGYCFP